MTAKEVLLKAACLLEQGWTQGHFACNKYGFSESVLSNKATCFCAVGALLRVTYNGAEYNDAEYNSAFEALEKHIRVHADFLDVVRWNDHRDRTQAEVVVTLREVADSL